MDKELQLDVFGRYDKAFSEDFACFGDHDEGAGVNLMGSLTYFVDFCFGAGA